MSYLGNRCYSLGCQPGQDLSNPDISGRRSVVCCISRCLSCAFDPLGVDAGEKGSWIDSEVEDNAKSRRSVHLV